MSELKPCPFCGGKVTIHDEDVHLYDNDAVNAARVFVNGGAAE